MKKRVCILLALLLALAAASYAEAADVYAAQGEKTVILDRDGLKITLSGEYEALDNVNGKAGNFMSHVKCVIENNTGDTVRVQYTGVINGWNIDSYHTMNGANSLPDGTKAKSDIWFTTEDCEVTCYEDLETMVLNFHVKPENGSESVLTTGTIHFNAEAPAGEAPVEEEAPAEEAPAEEVPAGEAPDEATVDALLQGKWVYESNGGAFTFTNGSLVLVANGATLEGTYTINTDMQSVDIVLKGSDADVKASLPYIYGDGQLKLFNNQGEEYVHEAPAEVPAEEAPDAATVDALLQGRWSHPTSGGTFVFSDGSVTMGGNGMEAPGTYTIDAAAQCVNLVFVTADGTAKAKLPYLLEDGQLILFNNQNEQLKHSAGADTASYETLDVGSRGDDVKKLQRYLISLGYLSGGADGIYGNGTAGGVKKFQAAEGLPETGTADPETQARLFAHKLAEEAVVVVPGKIEKVADKNYSLFIRFRNDGDEAVDNVEFYVYPYDASGNHLYDYYDSPNDEDVFDVLIGPGETSEDTWYYDVEGYRGDIAYIEAVIYRYHTVSGRTVNIPSDQRVWARIG